MYFFGFYGLYSSKEVKKMNVPNKWSSSRNVQAFNHNSRLFFNNVIIKNFLQSDHHRYLFDKVAREPSKANRDALNHCFKDFYTQIRFISYVSKVIHWKTIQFARDRTLEKTHFKLLLDTPINNDDNSITWKDQLRDESVASIEQQVINASHHFDDQILNPMLFHAWQQLTLRQQMILEYLYIAKMKDKEIANLFGISQQAVSKSKIRALAKLKSYCQEVS